jgi:hypothetical protein
MQDDIGADVSPEPEVEIDLTDMAAVEAASKEDRPVEPEVEEHEAESPAADEENVDEKTDEPKGDDSESEDSESSVQKRIDKLTANWRRTERELLAAEEQARQLQEQLESIPKPAEKVKLLEDFEGDWDAYREYLFTEADRKAEAAAERVVQRTLAEQSASKIADRFSTLEADFESKVEDYRETVYNPSLKISDKMMNEGQKSELGPEVFYYLGKHPEEAEEIFAASDRDVIRGIQRIELKLESAKEAASKKAVSKAPPPPTKKVSGVNSGQKVSTTSPDSDKLSDDEWFRREEARQAKLRGK